MKMYNLINNNLNGTHITNDTKEVARKLQSFILK